MTSFPADAGIAQQAELQALRSMMAISQGTFSLSFAVCNSPALQDFLIDRLRGDWPGLHVHTVSPECTDILEEVISSVGDTQVQGIFLVDVESGVSSGDSYHPALNSLNASREAWAKKFPCPIVFWVPEYVIRILYREARDLMAWRSHQFEFGPESTELEKAASVSVMSNSMAVNLSLEDKRFRIAELEGRISQAGPEIPHTLVPHVVTWMLELATLRSILGELEVSTEELRKAIVLLDRTSTNCTMADDDRCFLRATAMSMRADILQAHGELDEALRIRREEVLPVFDRLRADHERAVTMGKIADILYGRGEFDEALRIRRDEELPVYKRLGDMHSYAVTIGQIADILQARGEFDEAMRMLREEELPVVQRLGDIRERALTVGRIADILQVRGEMDEALRIRREEELPVYEQLGDVRERAVTMGKIADILRAHGELEEALRIRREEELPVYERLGEVGLRATSMGKIAEILHDRGDLDESVRIRREEQLPVYERLGDVRDLLLGRTNMAMTLFKRGSPEDRAEARQLLEMALAAARKLRIPEEKTILKMIGILGGL